MNSFKHQLIDLINKIYFESRKKENDLQAIEYIHGEFALILNFVKININNNTIDEYIKERDHKNEKIMEIAKNEMKNLHEWQNNYTGNIILEFKIMSSVYAKLNLIDGSDLDIGVLVDDLDDDKKHQLIDLFSKEPLEYKKMDDSWPSPDDPQNTYISLEKIIKEDEHEIEMEIELKIRNKQSVLSTIELHDILDNNLSDEERKLITYTKYILSQNMEHKKTYTRFKELVYETHSYGIKNARLFKTI